MSGRRLLATAMAIVLVVIGTTTAQTGAQPDPYTGADVVSPVDRPGEAAATLEPPQAAAVAVELQGQTSAGIEYWHRFEVFVVSLDDRVEIVDRSGTSVASLDLPGVVAMSFDLSTAVVADDAGRLHLLDRGGENDYFVLETLQVADAPLRAVAARHTTILFVAEDTPNTIRKLTIDSGEIDAEWFSLGEPIEQLRARPVTQASSATALYTIEYSNYVPSIDVRSVFDLEGISDFGATGFAGGLTWIASPLPQVTEVDYDGSNTGRVVSPEASIASVATDHNAQMVGFATRHDEAFDIRVHTIDFDRFNEEPVSLLALDPGLIVIPGGLALGRYDVGAVVSDPVCDCLRVVVVHYGPSFESPANPTRIERGPDAALVLEGQGFAKVESVIDDIDWFPVPFDVAADGRSMSIDVSGYGLGTHRVMIDAAYGLAWADFELYDPPPEPVPTDFTDTACPWVTDSVLRLYSAYFLRHPDEQGFDFWLDAYSSGEWSLPRASAFFSQSPEFGAMYGSVTDAEFIDLIYRNIFGRAADAQGRAYWVERMQRESLDRGTVMLYFSESPEYVQQTETSPPLAGYFNWYAEGTTWGCGVGAGALDLPAGSTWVDLAFWHFSSAAGTIEIAEYEEGRWVERHHSTLGPEAIKLFLGVERPHVVRSIALSSMAELAWTIVASPESTSPVREGWND